MLQRLRKGSGTASYENIHSASMMLQLGCSSSVARFRSAGQAIIVCVWGILVQVVAAAHFAGFQSMISRSRPRLTLRVVVDSDRMHGYSTVKLHQTEAAEAANRRFSLAEFISPTNFCRLFPGCSEYRYHSDLSVICWKFACLLYTSPSPRDGLLSRMPSSA